MVLVVIVVIDRDLNSKRQRRIEERFLGLIPIWMDLESHQILGFIDKHFEILSLSLSLSLSFSLFQI